MWRDEFGEWLRVKRSGRAVQAYMSDLQQFVRWWEGESRGVFAPAELTSMDVRAWQRYSLDTARVSPSTWNRRRASMAVFAEWARQAGYIATQVMQGVERAEQVELPPRWLAVDEFRRLMREAERAINGARTAMQRADALRDRAMIGLMGYAGLREGEVVALERGDVSVGERSGRVVVRRGKGGKRREVPLGSEARHVLREWLGVVQGERLFEVTERTVQRRVGELGRRAGVVDLTPHALRHTFAKRTLDGGVQLTVVSKLLGHSRLDVTARYTQPGWGDLAAAVEGL